MGRWNWLTNMHDIFKCLNLFLQQILAELDAGMHDSLSDVVTKSLNKLCKQPEPPLDEIDDTILKWSQVTKGRLISELEALMLLFVDFSPPMSAAWWKKNKYCYNIISENLFELVKCWHFFHLPVNFQFHSIKTFQQH